LQDEGYSLFIEINKTNKQPGDFKGQGRGPGGGASLAQFRFVQFAYFKK